MSETQKKTWEELVTENQAHTAELEAANRNMKRIRNESRDWCKKWEKVTAEIEVKGKEIEKQRIIISQLGGYETHEKMIMRLRESVEDDWKKYATEAYEEGTCPICFAVDEAPHEKGCYMLELADDKQIAAGKDKQIQALTAEVERLTALGHKINETWASKYDEKLAQITTLKAALGYYGWHRRDCDYLISGKPCDCGFEQALKEAE